MRDLKIYSIYKVTVRIQIPFASICIAMYCPLYGPCKEMSGICGCVWVRVRICMDMNGYGYVRIQVQVLGIDLYWNGRYGILNTPNIDYLTYIYHQLSSVLNF